MQHYNLIVIGFGKGGKSIASKASLEGKKY